MIPQPIKRYGESWPYAWQSMCETSSMFRRIPAKDEAARCSAYGAGVIKEQMTEGKSHDDELNPEDPFPVTYKAAVLHSLVEGAWHRHGRPAYLCTTSCYDALLRTNLNGIELADFRPPFNAIEIRLPHGRFERSPVAMVMGMAFTEEALSEIRSLGVPGVSECPNLFTILMQTKEQLDDPADGIASPYARGFAWLAGNKSRIGDSGCESRTKDERDGDFLHVALAICLLATHAHDELFTPLLLSKDQQLDPTDGGAFDVAAQRAVRRTHRRVWIIGRHLKCPTARHAAQSESVTTERELQFQHWRAGHFHKVRHGEGHNLSKLMWFRPVLVRPDLPLRPKHKRIYDVA